MEKKAAEKLDALKKRQQGYYKKHQESKKTQLTQLLKEKADHEKEKKTFASERKKMQEEISNLKKTNDVLNTLGLLPNDHTMLKDRVVAQQEEIQRLNEKINQLKNAMIALASQT
jgi:hypothetical protein